MLTHAFTHGIIQVITIAGLASISPQAPASSWCPSQIAANVQVGELEIDHSTDEDFRSLAHTAWEVDFQRHGSGSECIYSDQTGEEIETSLNHRMFLAIDKTRDGLHVVIEGYTPHGKLFSIQGRASTDREFNEMIPAQVSNGSGRREVLGAAEIVLSAKNE